MIDRIHFAFQFVIFLLINPTNGVENSLKMLPPEPELEGEGKLTVETEYFKPKEYSSRDFPRLIEGLGQQIRRDLGQAHSLMAAYSKQAQSLEQRMDRLEQQALDFPPNEFGEHPNSKLLAALWLFLLLFLVLAFLFCVNLLFLLLSSRRKTHSKRNNDLAKIAEI